MSSRGSGCKTVESVLEKESRAIRPEGEPIVPTSLWADHPDRNLYPCALGGMPMPDTPNVVLLTTDQQRADLCAREG